MDLEITTLMLAVSMLCMIFGVLAKNLIFAVAGGVLSIFLGISLAGEGLIVQRVVNETLVSTASKGGFIGGFGAVLVLLGIGVFIVIILDMLGGR